MFNINLSRKNLFAIFLGLLVIVGLGIITSTVSFFVISNIMRTTPVSEFKYAFSQQPILVSNWLSKIIALASPILGGFVVGYLVKEKGWLYGALLGFILLFISISIVSLIFILPTSIIYGPQFPPNYGHELAQKNILNQLLHSPLTIVLASLGGYLGERFYIQKVKK